MTKIENEPAGSPAPPKAPSLIDRYFGISAAASTVPRELRAGLTTFLAMSYIIFVNPDVLSSAIVVDGVDNIFTQLVITTCVAAAFGSLVMGLVARYPFAQAPGMGLNAFFAFTVVLGMGYTWQAALAAVFISGVLFVVLSVVGARRAIVKALPMSLKMAITAGIGGFLALIGMKNAGIVVADESTFVALGDIRQAPVWLALVGLVLTAVLMKLRVTGAILWGILATTVVAIVFRLPVYTDNTSFAGFTDGIVAAPFWPGDIAFKMDFGALLNHETLLVGAVTVVLTFFVVDFFDATGTLTGLAQRSGYVDEHGDMPRAKTLFSMDGLAAMFGAMMGTSTTTAYVESAAGVEEGGRTGLTAITTAALFVVAMFFWPLIGVVPSAATAPALIIVGAIMLEGVKHVDLDDIGEALPAFLTIFAMPFTYSIANGVSFGIISYALIKVLTGRWREASWLLYLLAALLIIRYVWLM
ncbi:NCS2 family permease [Naumannella halotolerans]|uniref:AGZA family xanthine/uracil permease-like MFS transporter n=1 Tax=Naumannella halotolerans TaxID=993414 RepID=A0A4R7J3A2_9ACTN|nr:NCS2 family permease [Naumannella halotolerans]TDT30867.1 AGZA family xanthine/uracil permease-like MFS transporter [Naumannella halotolerans]